MSVLGGIVFILAILQIYDVKINYDAAGKRNLKGRAKKRVQAFQREKVGYNAVSILGVGVCILNIAISATTCGIVFRTVEPFYALAKYQLYRLMYAKSAVFDGMKEAPVMNNATRIATRYVSPVVLILWMVSQLADITISSKAVTGFSEDMCVVQDRNEPLYISATAIVLALDVGVIVACIAMLLFPTVQTANRSVRRSAARNTVGALCSTMSTIAWRIFLVYGDVEADYQLTRFTSDYLLVAWGMDFLFLTVSLGLGSICCPVQEQPQANHKLQKLHNAKRFRTHGSVSRIFRQSLGLDTKAGFNCEEKEQDPGYKIQGMADLILAQRGRAMMDGGRGDNMRSTGSNSRDQKEDRTHHSHDGAAGVGVPPASEPTHVRVSGMADLLFPPSQPGPRVDGMVELLFGPTKGSVETTSAQGTASS